MARRPSRDVRSLETSQSAKTIWGVILSLAALLLAGAGVWAYVASKSERIELRSDTLCPKDGSRPPPAVYVVLIDQTDPIGALTQEAVSNAVMGQLRRELEDAADPSSTRHALIEVWTFRDKGGAKAPFRVGDVDLVTEKALLICNPGGAQEWDALYKNVDVVRRQHARFYDAFRGTIAASLGFPEAQQSPVVEALYGMGVQVFSKPEFAAARKRLIVVSDFLQNTKTLSMFAGAPAYAKWSASPQAARTLPNLRDVDVTGLVLPNGAPGRQGQEFVEFWFALLNASGARVRFERVR